MSLKLPNTGHVIGFTVALAIVWGGALMGPPSPTELAKQRLGGDFEVAQRIEPVPYDIAAFAMLDDGKISRVAETSTVATAGIVNANISLKGIDGSYPLYGKLALLKGKTPYSFYIDPGRGISGAAVDKRFLKALGINLGDSFTIGNSRFEVTAIIIDEPDAPTGKMALLPRVIVSGKAFFSTGIAETNNRNIIYRLRVKLAPSTNLEDIHSNALDQFPEPTWVWKNWYDVASDE